MGSKKPAHKLLFDKWSEKNSKLTDSILQKHGDSLRSIHRNSKNLAVGALGSLIMLSANPVLPTHADKTKKPEASAPAIDKKSFLISDLSTVLPDQVQPLDSTQDSKVSDILSRNFGIEVTSELDGKSLNTTYGLIGAEQHLARFPGDSMGEHFDNANDANKYTSSGMAPGLGAWGYFASSQASMTSDDNDKEKYYIAVQTFLSKDFSQRFAEYRDFYKYRKMLVVNPNNGKAVVADIADAGPSPYTGKQLGGSPEVMNYLERQDGAAKGPVLYYFIKDSEDKVPLGPIQIVK